MKSNFTVAMVWALGSAFGAHAQNDTILTRSQAFHRNPFDQSRPIPCFAIEQFTLHPSCNYFVSGIFVDDLERHFE